MGIYVKFTMIAHQISSRHVTLASNSETFYLSPYSILNFRKLLNLEKFAEEKKSYRKKKQIGGWKTPPPPSAYRVNWGGE